MTITEENTIQDKLKLLEQSGNFAVYNNKSYRVSKKGDYYLIFSKYKEPNFEPRKAPLEGYVQEVNYNEIEYGYSVYMNVKYRGFECSVISLKKNNNIVLRSSEKIDTEQSVIRDRDSYITEVNLADPYLTVVPTNGRAFNLPTDNEYKDKKRKTNTNVVQLKQYINILNTEIDRVENIELKGQEITKIIEVVESLIGSEKVEKYKRL